MDEILLSHEELEAITYRYHGVRDFILDDNLPADPPGGGYSDLGTLGVLPLELLHAALSPLDLGTLMAFRRVSLRAMEVVDSIPSFKPLATHAGNVLLGMEWIGTGKYITCEALYEKLCTKECEYCGDFGDYLYILTFNRVCFLCFSTTNRYVPMEPSRAIAQFGITEQIVDTLPCMWSMPGMYTPYEKLCPERMRLVDCRSAWHAGIRLHGGGRALEVEAEDVTPRTIRDYDMIRKNEVETVPGFGRQVGRAYISPYVDYFDGDLENPMRFMAISRMPSLNKHTQEPEWGFHCLGCQKETRSRQRNWRRKFTLESFVEHLLKWGYVQDGEHTRRPPSNRAHE